MQKLFFENNDCNYAVKELRSGLAKSQTTYISKQREKNGHNYIYSFSSSESHDNFYRSRFHMNDNLNNVMQELRVSNSFGGIVLRYHYFFVHF